MNRLREGYSRLRRTSLLGAETGPFEGVAWKSGPDGIIRHAHGRTLKVYEIEGQIEASITYPDGTCKTFS